MITSSHSPPLGLREALAKSADSYTRSRFYIHSSTRRVSWPSLTEWRRPLPTLDTNTGYSQSLALGIGPHTFRRWPSPCPPLNLSRSPSQGVSEGLNDYILRSLWKATQAINEARRVRERVLGSGWNLRMLRRRGMDVELPHSHRLVVVMVTCSHLSLHTSPPLLFGPHLLPVDGCASLLLLTQRLAVAALHFPLDLSLSREIRLDKSPVGLAAACAVPEIDAMSPTIVTIRPHSRAGALQRVMAVLPAIKAVICWRVHCRVGGDRPQPTEHHAAYTHGRRGARLCPIVFSPWLLVAAQPLLSWPGWRRRSLSPAWRARVLLERWRRTLRLVVTNRRLTIGIVPTCAASLGTAHARRRFPPPLLPWHVRCSRCLPLGSSSRSASEFQSSSS